VIATLHCSVAKDGSLRCEFRDGADALILVTLASGPHATRLLDAAGQQILGADARSSDARSDRRGPPLPADVRNRTVGSGTIMVSCAVAGRPAWVIDDYENRTRHVIFGGAADHFLHVHRDSQGAVTVTEKNRDYVTLRSVRYDASGALLADEATVQPGEDIDTVARRCGVSTAALRAANWIPALSSPPSGTTLRLA
jgi:hypothetical protein